jgi:outer membrane beta-barrel protein
MTRRLHVLLLSAVGAAAGFAPVSHAQSIAGADPAAQPEVVAPDVERRTVKPAPVTRENFETGVFVGAMNIQDFGSVAVYGARLAYHLTEDFFAEAVFGAARAGRSSFEEMTHDSLVPRDKRDYRYYDFALGWNALPGEVFIGRGRAMPSALYFTLGAGDTSFANDHMFTATLGIGYRLLLSDRFAAHVDARDQIYDIDISDHNRRSQNLQLTAGLTAFF